METGKCLRSDLVMGTHGMGGDEDEMQHFCPTPTFAIREKTEGKVTPDDGDPSRHGQQRSDTHHDSPGAAPKSPKQQRHIDEAHEKHGEARQSERR